jgi:hypothetical protein
LLREASESTKAAQGAARTAQASSWAAQKDATKASKASGQAIHASELLTGKVENWDDVSVTDDADPSTWDELAQTTDEVDEEPEQASFWSIVPENNDGSLLDDAEDSEWIERFRKRWPFGSKEDDGEAETQPEEEQLQAGHQPES